MLGTNIADLRRRNSLTQEALAEKLAVSRQTLAKWERNESDPDIQSVIRLAELFQVSLDDLVHYDKRENLGLEIPPKGRHFFGSVPVGEQGEVVLPEKARQVFRLAPGDEVLLFADEERGLALVPRQALFHLMDLVFREEQDGENGENRTQALSR